MQNGSPSLLEEQVRGGAGKGVGPTDEIESDPDGFQRPGSTLS